MRKFLYEYETVFTLEQLETEYRTDRAEDFDGTFAQWLEECTGKNGALTEILTDDTPRWNRKSAVIECVVYGDDENDDYFAWLTLDEIARKRSCGYCVKACAAEQEKYIA